MALGRISRGVFAQSRRLRAENCHCRSGNETFQARVTHSVNRNRFCIDAGMLFFWRRPLFKAIATEVLGNKFSVYAPTTKRLAEFHIDRLVSHFGNTPVDRISDTEWAKYLVAEKQKRPRTFFDDRKFMRIVLFHAQSKQLLGVVPKLPIPDLPSEAGRELSGDEIAALERHAGPTLLLQIRIAYQMGLRLREMLRLDWEKNFDWKTRCIILAPSENRKGKKWRRIPIPPSLMRQLKARRAQATSNFVFPSPVGGKACFENKDAWKRCKRKAGIRTRWHDLRHHCATNLRRRGAPDHIVGDTLGMNKKTLKRYTHLGPEDLKILRRAMRT